MKPKILSLLLLFTWLFSACASQIAPTTAPTAASQGLTITDALGRTVHFDAPPQRIVLAGKAIFMVADAVYLFPQAGSRIVGMGSPQQNTRSFIPMIDPDFANKTILDSNAGVEQIAALQPDCVIMKSTNASTLGAALETAQIPVLYLDFETPAQYERDLKILGQLFEDPARAEMLTQYYQSGANAIAQAVADLSEEQKPRVLLLYYNEKDGAISFNVPPLTWMQTLMVQQAGGRPVWADANPSGGWMKVGLEQIAAWNADVIFVATYAQPIDAVIATLKADAQWQALQAVKNNRLYGFATDVYSWDQPDTRWILGLTWMAGKLHPDRLPGLDMTERARAFYAALYGMDQASFEKNILPMLTGDIR
ncbi:MAG: ABC transporter substrate-binding protein [Longilinea sp.]|mgnify:CR=1 FL=1|nr:ABC transporter substrate-binding protein [Longilinea sp.]